MCQDYTILGRNPGFWKKTRENLSVEKLKGRRIEIKGDPERFFI
jgi:hypothetical protein